jgi:hypothetical protein
MVNNGQQWETVLSKSAKKRKSKVAKEAAVRQLEEGCARPFFGNHTPGGAALDGAALGGADTSFASASVTTHGEGRDTPPVVEETDLTIPVETPVSKANVVVHSSNKKGESADDAEVPMKFSQADANFEEAPENDSAKTNGLKSKRKSTKSAASVPAPVPAPDPTDETDNKLGEHDNRAENEEETSQNDNDAEATGDNGRSKAAKHRRNHRRAKKRRATRTTPLAQGVATSWDGDVQLGIVFFIILLAYTLYYGSRYYTQISSTTASDDDNEEIKLSHVLALGLSMPLFANVLFQHLYPALQ